MKIFSGKLTEKFLNNNCVFILPPDGEGAALALKRLDDLGFGIDEDWSIADAVRHGIYIDHGDVYVAENSGGNGKHVFYATVAQLVSGYQDPLTRAFSTVAQNQAETEKRLAELEKRLSPAAVKKVILIDDPMTGRSQ
jgi:hypothetical protein